MRKPWGFFMGLWIWAAASVSPACIHAGGYLELLEPLSRFKNAMHGGRHALAAEILESLSLPTPLVEGQALLVLGELRWATPLAHLRYHAATPRLLQAMGTTQEKVEARLDLRGSRTLEEEIRRETIPWVAAGGRRGELGREFQTLWVERAAAVLPVGQVLFYGIPTQDEPMTDAQRDFLFQAVWRLARSMTVEAPDRAWAANTLNVFLSRFATDTVILVD